MCNFFSILVNKTGRVIGDGLEDSHASLMEANKIDDSDPKYLLKWAKVEITPKDNDKFNHDLDNWVLKVDEERKPDWFGPKHEEACYQALQKCFKEKFLIGGEFEEINKDIRFAKDVKINILRSKIGEMWGNSKIGVMWESSKIGVMRGSSNVGVMWGNSKIGEMWGNSKIGEMWDSSKIGVMWDSSNVGVMWGNSKIGVMRGDNTVNIYSESVTVKKQEGGRSVLIKRYLQNVEVQIL